MSSDENKRINREKRGQITPEDLKPYSNFPDTYLIELLDDDFPKKRTISAARLGRRQIISAVIPLASALKYEKALYSRIAISKALSEIGEPSIDPLIDLLGEIGNNQETELPQKYFNKKSYPLVRDMAARTLVKIGKPATLPLIRILKDEDSFKVQQAIDAVGGIAAKTSDERGLKSLISILQSYWEGHDKVTSWKIVRALGGFRNCEDATGPLLMVIEYAREAEDDFPIVWESVRSLGQIGVENSQIMNLLLELSHHQNSEISKASKIAMKQFDN
jgi:HEAT repeat protein